jgi:hypothetical protein
MQGFWTVKFGTPRGTGAGVAYFTENQVFGGDSGFTYIGTYETRDKEIAATLRVNPHTPGMASVFGNGQPFDLTIAGSNEGGKLVGTGTASHVPGLSFQVTLTKVA